MFRRFRPKKMTEMHSTSKDKGTFGKMSVVLETNKSSFGSQEWFWFHIVLILDFITKGDRHYYNFFFYMGFLSQPFKNHRTAGEGGRHFFNSSLPPPHASQTLTHQPSHYCRELTSAHRQQQDSKREPLISERKSLTTQLCVLQFQNVTAVLSYNATKVYYKMRQLFYYKCDSFITKCDIYYKMRQLY